MTVKDSGNFAATFKSAYEGKNINLMNSIIDEWIKIESDDANFYLAQALLAEFKGEVDDCFDFFQVALKKSPLDDEVYPWYIDRVMDVLDDYVENVATRNSEVVEDAESVDEDSDDVDESVDVEEDSEDSGDVKKLIADKLYGDDDSDDVDDEESVDVVEGDIDEESGDIIEDDVSDDESVDVEEDSGDVKRLIADKLYGGDDSEDSADVGDEDSVDVVEDDVSDDSEGVNEDSDSDDSGEVKRLIADKLYGGDDSEDSADVDDAESVDDEESDEVIEDDSDGVGDAEFVDDEESDEIVEDDADGSDDVDDEESDEIVEDDADGSDDDSDDVGDAESVDDEGSGEIVEDDSDNSEDVEPVDDDSDDVVEAKPVEIIEDDDEGFAKEFLDCCLEFEKTDDFDKLEELHTKMEDILDRWGEKYPNDANFTCAYVIMNILDLSEEELSEWSSKAESQTPINKEYHVYLAGNMEKLVRIRLGHDDLLDLMSGMLSDYPKDFIECYNEIESTEDSSRQQELYEKMKNLVDAWEAESPEDANFTCAYIMMNVFNIGNDEILDLVLKSLSQEPADEEYADEFMLAMRKIVEMKRMDDKGLLEDDDIEEEDDSTDSGFAKKFLECLDDFEECDDALEHERIYSKMGEILRNWQEKHPADANCVCANVIMNVFELSDDDLSTEILKVNHLAPLDEESHPKLVGIMHKFISMRSGMEDEVNLDFEIEDKPDSNAETAKEDKAEEVAEEEAADEVNYAETFLVYINTFNRLEDVEEQAQLHLDMIDFVNQWGEKYPDDANYTLAYITANVLSMDDDEIRQLLEKFKGQKPVSGKYHKRIRRICKDILDNQSGVDMDEFTN